jgi:hypothetical protein
MPNKPWTKSEVDLLLSKKNVPTRSKKSIRRKQIQLGLKKKKFTVTFHRKFKWSEEEIHALKNNLPLPNRSRQSIRTMMARLGLLEKNKPRRPWKKKDERLLVKLVGENKSLKKIFEMQLLPYSKNAIQKKLQSLGLTKKTEQKKFDKKNLQKFKDFLIKNWQGKTPDELLDIWNKQNQISISKNKILYHLSALKIKISYGEVSKIKNLRKKEEIIKNKQHSSVKKMEEEIMTNRAKIMRERYLAGKDIWTGLKTDEWDKENE